MKVIEGKLIGNGKKFAIIQSRFNEFIGDGLLKAAYDCLLKHGVNENSIDIIKVPGAFEIPLTADRLASKKKYDSIICLGVIIRGATPHFEYVCKAVVDGVTQLNMLIDVPVIFGVLTVDSQQQAEERIGGVHGHKGEEAAMTALKMIVLNLSLKK